MSAYRQDREIDGVRRGSAKQGLVRNVVKRLRRKPGDAADISRFIFTEPRVGYRMAMGEGETKDET